MVMKKMSDLVGKVISYTPNFVKNTALALTSTGAMMLPIYAQEDPTPEDDGVVVASADDNADSLQNDLRLRKERFAWNMNNARQDFASRIREAHFRHSFDRYDNFNTQVGVTRNTADGKNSWGASLTHAETGRKESGLQFVDSEQYAEAYWNTVKQLSDVEAGLMVNATLGENRQRGQLGVRGKYSPAEFLDLVLSGYARHEERETNKRGSNGSTLVTELDPMKTVGGKFGVDLKNDSALLGLAVGINEVYMRSQGELRATTGNFSFGETSNLDLIYGMLKAKVKGWDAYYIQTETESANGKSGSEQYVLKTQKILGANALLTYANRGFGDKSFGGRVIFTKKGSNLANLLSRTSSSADSDEFDAQLDQRALQNEISRNTGVYQFVFDKDVSETRPDRNRVGVEADWYGVGSDGRLRGFGAGLTRELEAHRWNAHLNFSRHLSKYQIHVQGDGNRLTGGSFDYTIRF